MRSTAPMLAGIVFMTLLMLLFNYFASSSSPISSALGWTNQIHNGITLFPIAIGAFVFIIISRINFDRVPELVSRTIVGISSTTFGIYLLHENIFGFRILWEYVSRICYAPDNLLLRGIAAFSIVIAVFLALSCIAKIVDTLFVHPLTDKILSVINKRTN
jgi:hypothetical protein